MAEAIAISFVSARADCLARKRALGALRDVVVQRHGKAFSEGSSAVGEVADAPSGVI
jgi:hypothetical protein